MRHRLGSSVVALLALTLGLTSCSTSTGESAEDDRPTLVEVEPAAFLGNVACGPEAGAAKTYLARLFDLTPLGVDGDDRLELSSSGPVDCKHSAAFGWVVPGHRYGARVLGYDRPAEELVEAAPGIPVLLDAETRLPVDPVWTSDCGLDNPPLNAIIAEAQLTRRVRNCSPFVLSDGSTQSQVVFTLTEERCAASGVDQFLVRRNGEDVGSGECGAEVVISDLEPGEFVEVNLLAYAADAEQPTHGAVCGARAVPGIRVTGVCDDLGENGTVLLPLADVLEALDTRCGPDLVGLDLTFSEATPPNLSFGSSGCSGFARFAELSPGSYDFTAVARIRGQAERTAVCTADVEPGLSTRPACSLAD